MFSIAANYVYPNQLLFDFTLKSRGVVIAKSVPAVKLSICFVAVVKVDSLNVFHELYIIIFLYI